MSDVTLDDYLIHGPRAALDVICDITGAPEVDIVGLCLGGALTAMLAAYLAKAGDARLGTVTLLNTLLDYSEPGVLGAFADERTVARLERQMARSGVMRGSQMAGTFDLLRANDLMFSYVVSELADGPAPAGLRHPRLERRQHAAAGRHALASTCARCTSATSSPRADWSSPGRPCAGGREERRLHRRRGQRPHRAVDIVLQGHRAARRHVRYVLSSGGHIAGIVNPPGPKAWYETAEASPPDPAQWRAEAQRHSGSWWEDWAAWAGARAGDLVDPPPMGIAALPGARRGARLHTSGADTGNWLAN